MTYSLFYSYASEVSLRVAQELALANGVSLAQVQLWVATAKASLLSSERN